MKIQYIFQILFLALAAFVLGSCDESNPSNLNLKADVQIISFSLNGHSGTIDQTAQTITVNVPESADITAMTPQYTLTEGAKADLASGKAANFSLPIAITISNGNVYQKYTVIVKVDEAKIKSFTINGSYIGSINETTKAITVYVPQSTDVSKLTATYTTTDGATASPESGSVIDFTNPVIFTVTNNSAKTEYTVTVVPTNIQYTAFVGTAASVDQIESPEEKAAAEWMLQNISGSEYISFANVASGNVQLGKYSAVWWHWHVDGYSDATGLPIDATKAISAFKIYYQNGGNLLLTRFASRYIASLGISIDGKSPNNCWGGAESSPEIASSPWGISFKGHTGHPIFKNLQTTSNKNYVAYLFNTGYAVTNSTAQWHIGSDWGGYSTKAAWENTTGGIALGRSDGDADNEAGAIVIAEFPSRSGSGKVIVIGSGAYDWYGNGTTTTGTYRSNLTTMTQNAIEYLAE